LEQTMKTDIEILDSILRRGIAAANERQMADGSPARYVSTTVRPREIYIGGIPLVIERGASGVLWRARTEAPDRDGIMQRETVAISNSPADIARVALGRIRSFIAGTGKAWATA
jgi:hypothetical protein